MPTTTEPGSARVAMMSMFLSLMDPVLPFTADGDDPDAGWDVPVGRADTPERAEDPS